MRDRNKSLSNKSTLGLVKKELLVEKVSSLANIRKRRQRLSGVDTRLNIILNGEYLFAERGIEAVSLREIAVKAGQGNNNAVQYHFESKETFLHEIFRHRVKQLEEKRFLMLDLAREAGLTGDAKTLLSIVCLPYLDLRSKEGTYSYVLFLAQYLNRYYPAGLGHPLDDDTEGKTATNQVIALLYAIIEDVPREFATYRIILSVHMFLNAVIMYESSASKVDFSDLLEDTLEAMAAAFCVSRRASDSRSKPPGSKSNGALGTGL